MKTWYRIYKENDVLKLAREVVPDEFSYSSAVTDAGYLSDPNKKWLNSAFDEWDIEHAYLGYWA